MKQLTILITLVALFGCSNNDNRQQPPLNSIGVLHTDNTVISTDPKFNNWHGSIVSGMSDLTLKQQEDITNYSNPAIWALVVRTVSNPTGTVYANTADVRLFSNYTDQCCLNQDDPFGKFESADKSFLAVSGFINFTSSHEARFNIDFQEESGVRNNHVAGPIVNASGCWKIGGEGTASGCDQN